MPENTRRDNDSERLFRRGSARSQAKSGLLRMLDDHTLDPDFVSAVAGDLPMNDESKRRLEELRQRRGRRLYSDLLFAISHQYFPEEQAEEIWSRILQHKYEMSIALKRNAKIAVAALDYLTNITDLLDQPMLISKPKMAVVAEVALRDGMTELFDHTTFLAKLRNEMNRVHRYGNKISIALFDLDRFKQYNDTHGHLAGDRALSDVGRILRQEARDVDVASRYGGEEFVIMLPRTEMEDAVHLAERVRRRVEESFRERGGLTISAGVATCPDHARSAMRLLAVADKALYASKHLGRNRTTTYPTASGAEAEE